MLVALLLSTALAQGATGPTMPLIMVLPVVGDAPERERALVHSRLLQSAAAIAPVLSRTAMEEQLATARALGVACDLAAAECALKMAGLAGVRWAVSATLDRRSALTLRVHDVSVERSGGAISELLPADPASRARAIDNLVVRALAPDRVAGSLELLVHPPGASVTVDDVFRGQAPLSRALLLAPGKHAVYVNLAGHDPATREIEIRQGETARLEVVLVPLPGTPVAAVEPHGEDRPDDDGARALVEGLLEGARPAGGLTVAVMPFQAEGLEQRVADVIAAAYSQELARRQGLAVVAPDEVRRMLAAQPGCAFEVPCLARVAGALGAGAFVVGRVEQVERVAVVSTKRLDTETGEAMLGGRATSLTGDRRALVNELPDVVDATFPEFPVRPGTEPDLDRFAGSVAAPGLPPWVLFAGVGATGTLALVTGGAGALALIGDQDTVDAAVPMLAVGAGATAVAFTLTLVAGAFVDWDG